MKDRENEKGKKYILLHTQHLVNISKEYIVFVQAHGKGWQVHPTVHLFIHTLVLNKKCPPQL